MCCRAHRPAAQVRKTITGCTCRQQCKRHLMYSPKTGSAACMLRRTLSVTFPYTTYAQDGNDESIPCCRTNHI